jgi:hypothetical protein
MTRSSIDRARRFRVYVWEHTLFDKASDVAELMLRSNANAIRISGVSQHGNYTLFDSEFFPRHPGLERDLLRELADEFARHDDLHLFPYNSLGYFAKGEICQGLENDYRALGADGSFIEAWWAGETGYAVCLNNPYYVEAFAGACVEMVRDYGASGIYFDGPRWGWWGACYCPHCKAVVERAHGGEVSNERLDEHRLEVREHGYVYSVSTIKKAVTAIRDVPIVFNLTIEEREMLPVMGESEGALVAEAHRGQSSFMRVLSFVKTGAAFHAAQWAYSPPGNYNDFVTHDSLDTKLFGTMQLAHGATPIVETMHSYLHDDTGVPAVRDMFGLMQANEELYFEYEPVRDIALLYSAQSMTGDHEYQEHYQGAFRALTHDHQQFSVILDRDLTIEELSRFKVLFLSQAVCLSQAQLAAIAAFVRRGGGLVATGKTSLCDENGEERANFGLAELFGADFRSMIHPEWVHAYGPRMYARVNGEGGIISRPAAGRLIAHDYTFAFSEAHHADGVLYSVPAIESRPGATVVADSVYVDEDPAWTAPDGCFMPPYELRTTGPAATAQSYGSGRVVYTAHSFDKLYGARAFVDVLQLINSAVDWVSGKKERLIRIDAPSGLLCNLTERDDSRALHLVNYTGSINEHPVYRVDWVAPLVDIDITLEPPAGKKLTGASLLSSGKEVLWREDGDTVKLQVSVLEGYECVLFTYD